jgi:hypothetical protein
MIHASTSQSWFSALHRHGPEDDCVSCRFRGAAEAQFTCSGGALEKRQSRDDRMNSASESEASTDAALPFLSASAGLLIAAALVQLESGYLDSRYNHHRLLFESGIVTSWQSTIAICRDECRERPSRRARQSLNTGKRWADLDDEGGPGSAS